MKPKFSSTLFAVTTAVISSFTLIGSASAASLSDPVDYFGNQDTADNYNAVFSHFRDSEQENLDLTVTPGSSRLVDLDNLMLNYDSDVSITFLGEGTRKKNDFAYSVNGGASQMIWDDINAVHDSNADFLSTKQDSEDPEDGTMNFGDSMSLGSGSFAAGDQFEFLLTPEWSRGQNPGDVVYSSLTNSNPDGLQHAVAYALDDRYMIMGFEDLYGDKRRFEGPLQEGSDRDFNDVLFLVDMGEGNLASVPEPATASALFAAGALGLFGVRRRKS